MKPTRNAKMLQERIDASGLTVDGNGALDQHGGYALINENGFVLFVESGPQLYKITAGFAPKKRGKEAIEAINAAYRWLFENTDADQVMGSWAADGPVTAICALVHGGEWKRQGDLVFGTVTRARWQKAAG